jgi:hypothetical protein
MYVSPQSRLLVILQGLVGVAGELNGAKLKLFTNDFQPVPTSVVGDFTEATQTGYAATTITWGTPYVNDSGWAEVLSQLITTIFSAGLAEGGTIYGYYLTNTAGSTLLLSERLDNPIAITRDGQAIDIVARYVFGQ